MVPWSPNACHNGDVVSCVSLRTRNLRVQPLEIRNFVNSHWKHESQNISNTLYNIACTTTGNETLLQCENYHSTHIYPDAFYASTPHRWNMPAIGRCFTSVILTVCFRCQRTEGGWSWPWVLRAGLGWGPRNLIRALTCIILSSCIMCISRLTIMWGKIEWRLDVNQNNLEESN